jgi:hypothetical protein
MNLDSRFVRTDREFCQFHWFEKVAPSFVEQSSIMTFWKLLLLIAALAALWGPTRNARAADVTLSTSDILTGSQSSLDTSLANGNNWAGGVLPEVGNDYFTGNFVLRTPANNGSLTFAGDSLTINNTNDFQNGGFWYKGTGTTGTITIDNLILDGGIMTHQNGTGDIFRLDGNLHVASASQIFPRQGPINLSSTLTGSATLTVPGSNSAACVLRVLSPSNTFSGNIVNNGRLEFVDDSLMNFVVGGSGVNNSIAGNGALTALNGDLNIDLTNASDALGDSWDLVTANASYGSSFNILGFTEINNTWRNGIYQFSEATGILSVAPSLGDVNGDGDIDQFDYDAILAHFRTSVGSRAEGDLNGDGFVDLTDFAEWRLAREEFLLRNATAVPEPASLAVCLLGLWMVLLGRSHFRTRPIRHSADSP